MRSLQGYLVGIATAFVLLVCGATALLVWQIRVADRAETQRQLLDTTRAMSLAVDGELQTYEALLRALRASEAVAQRDWPAVDRQARQFQLGPDAWLVVGDRAGHQLVNTRLPPGAKMPAGAPNPALWTNLDRGVSRICDLARGRIEHDILCVDVPVMGDRRAEYHLSVVFRPHLLQKLIDRQRIGPERFATVIDRQGRVIWRNVTPERFVGRPATPQVMAAIRSRSESVRTTRSMDGVPALIAFSRSPLSGWTFSVAVPTTGLAAGGTRVLAYGFVGLALLLLSGVATGLLAGRRVASAVGRLSLAARRIDHGDAPPFEPSGLREIDEVELALRAAAAQRNASQERFNLAQEVGGIGSWDWNVPRDEGQVSESYRQMHGLTDTSGPLSLAQVLATVHPDDRRGYIARLQAATRTPTPSINEYRVVHPDGSIRWISSKGRPIFAPDGTFIEAVGIVRDVTAEHDAAAAIRQSEQRLALALAAGRMAVWEVDAKGRLLANPALNALLGLSADATPRLADLEASYQAGELKRIRGEATQALARGERFLEIEYRFRRPDGAERWFNTRAEVMRDGDGAPAGAIGIVTDVTERKTADERLRLLMREVDHRANNLMAVVQGAVRLSRSDDPAEQREIIVGRVQALARAHQLLSESRWVGADLRRLVEEEMLPYSLGDGGRVEIVGDSLALPPQAAQGLAMAIHELATNASKHGALSAPDGRVRIAWSVEAGRLKMTWVERGGPRVEAPRRRGFGTTVLSRALGGPIRGSTHLDWQAEGLTCVLELPLADNAPEPVQPDHVAP